MFDPEFQKRLVEAGTEILNKIGVEAQMKYMRNSSGDSYASRYLFIRTGDLARAVMGVGKGAIRNVRFVGDRFEFQIGIGEEIPYAALHEMGGVRQVTNKMRGFFKGRFDETKENKWKYMQMARVLKFPKREYLWSAIQDNIGYINEKVGGMVKDYVVTKIDRTITGKKGAGDIYKFIAKERFGGK